MNHKKNDKGKGISQASQPYNTDRNRKSEPVEGFRSSRWDERPSVDLINEKVAQVKSNSHLTEVSNIRVPTCQAARMSDESNRKNKRKVEYPDIQKVVWPTNQPSTSKVPSEESVTPCEPPYTGKKLRSCCEYIVLDRRCGEIFSDGHLNTSSDGTIPLEYWDSISVFENIESSMFLVQKLYQTHLPGLKIQARMHDHAKKLMITDRMKGSLLFVWAEKLMDHARKRDGSSFFSAEQEFIKSVLGLICNYIRNSGGLESHGDLLNYIFFKEDGQPAILAPSFRGLSNKVDTGADVKAAWSFMLFAANGYDPRKLGSADLLGKNIDSAAPQWFRLFFRFLKSGEYKRFPVEAALNPPGLLGWEEQLKRFDDANEEWHAHSDLMIRGGFERHLDFFSAKDEGKKGADVRLPPRWIRDVKSLPAGSYLRFSLETDIDKAADQDWRKRRGLRIHDAPAAVYERNASLPRWVRNLDHHPHVEWGRRVSKAELIEMLNADPLNFGWKLFFALLSCAMDLVAGSEQMGFLERVGLIRRSSKR